MTENPSCGIPIEEAKLQIDDIYKDIEIISVKLSEINYTAKNPVTVPTEAKIRVEIYELMNKIARFSSLLIPMDIKHLNSVDFEGDFLNPINQRRSLIRHISQLSPLIEISPDNVSESIFSKSYTDEIISSLRMLDAGEVPDLFQPAARKAGQRHNSWSMSERKLAALMWQERLRSAGYSAGEAQGMITDGFGQTWSTIFGWKRQCERVLGKDTVDRELKLARQSGRETTEDIEEVRFRIKVDGQAFNRQCSTWETPLMKEWIVKWLKDRQQNSNE